MVIAITIVMPCLLLSGHLLHSQVELDLKRSRLVGRSGSAMMLCYEACFSRLCGVGGFATAGLPGLDELQGK